MNVVDDEDAIGDARHLVHSRDDVSEVMRAEPEATASKLASANGRSSARQTTSGAIPGASV